MDRPLTMMLVVPADIERAGLRGLVEELEAGLSIQNCHKLILEE